VSLGGFSAYGMTIWGSQTPWVEASLGFYNSGFIQTNKQTNKQTSIKALVVERGFSRIDPLL